MNDYIFVALFGLAIFLPFVLAGNNERFWKIAGLIFLGFVSYSIYDAIYPSDSFYEKEFERVSGMSFPKVGVITQKYSTYPDIHGDYTSCALIELSAADYNLIRQRLMSEAKHKETPISTICGQVNVSGKQTALELTVQDGERGEYSNWGVIEGTSMAFFNFWSS